MFYRWSINLAGPFPQSEYGSYYIMVMIQHIRKWAAVVAIPTKEACKTVRVFRKNVLRRYGEPAEVQMDQGTEFRCEFQEMLDEALIDHRRTSRDHPHADGLAKRMVHTLKVALRKACLTGKVFGWEGRLAAITMGYRMSTHEFLAHFSPYYLLFAR